ncbi:hypothetical protein T07_2970 [Trichinella nelsoni]|uniref:Uncharacterized protein n=1 Tax=Trichinella nelsoni TaxID=6336 RepID=A0A0V0RNT8_9BILA|nr:hypothetical protein T07_2970 [Trichinella nelsoni]
MIVQKAELNVSSAANGCPYAEGLFQETGLAQMSMKMVSGSGGGGGGRRVGWTRAASLPPTTMSSSSSSSLVTIRRGQCCLRRPPVGRDSPAEPDCWALAMVNVAELLALRAVCPLSTGLSNEMKTEEEEIVMCEIAKRATVEIQNCSLSLKIQIQMDKEGEEEEDDDDDDDECTCDSTAVKKPNAIYIRDRREVSKERLERHHQRSAFRPMIGRNCSGRIERPDWSLTGDIYALKTAYGTPNHP